MDFAACGDLIYGLVIGLFAVEFNILKYLFLIFLGILGSVFYVCSEIIIRMLTIKIGNTDNIENVYINTLMINFGSYPEVIYSNVIKFLIYTVIPSAYVSFVPIKFITTFKIEYLLLFMLILVIYVSLTVAISKKLLKKYESGNNIALKG